jgi:ferric-dicitrate binding protein FerR (iron transport regulator)
MNALGLLPEKEAVAWFAKQRRGVMTLEEREAFAVWRHEPANAVLYAELEHAWALLRAAENRFTPAAVAELATRRHRIARSALLAAVCAVSLGLGVLSYSGNPEFWTTLDWVGR